MVKLGKAREYKHIEYYVNVGFAYMTFLPLRISLLNHSCQSNTNGFAIGEYMFTVATKDIKKGEEITTNILSSDFVYEDKAATLANRYLSKCLCEAC